MLQCWQEDPANRPSFSELRSSFTAMLQADSADGYIDLQVNNEAPYYQIEDITQWNKSNQCLQAYGFIRISYGIALENTEYGESDLIYGL